jgi:peptidyl-prolyl cis-trans isomerase B (cyclophilin B)
MPKKSKQPPQRRSRPPVARSWWWIGGVLVILPLIAVAAGCTGGPGERSSTSMPKNPADRADMYSEPPAMQIDAAKTYVATISTAKGDVVVQLDASAAPQTVNNFVFLARAGFYDGLTFHRVEPGFVIQGGDPAGTGSGGPGYTVPAEIQLPHVEGAIAMARRGDQVNPTRASSGSQFYITLAPTPFLDGAYTAFGQVTTGMDVVQSIAVGDVIERITITEGS